MRNSNFQFPQMTLGNSRHFAGVKDLEGLQYPPVTQLATKIEILDDVPIRGERKILINCFNPLVARLLGGSPVLPTLHLRKLPPNLGEWLPKVL